MVWSRWDSGRSPPLKSMWYLDSLIISNSVWAMTLVSLPSGSPGNLLLILPPSIGVMEDLRLSQGVLNWKTGMFTTGTEMSRPFSLWGSIIL
ncbi:hypothetical protein ES707_20152 [subsurface metagenome]